MGSRLITLTPDSNYVVMIYGLKVYVCCLESNQGNPKSEPGLLFQRWCCCTLQLLDSCAPNHWTVYGMCITNCVCDLYSVYV